MKVRPALPQTPRTLKIGSLKLIKLVACRHVGINTQILEIIKKENEQREQQFAVLTNILEEQNKQRDRMLNILQDLTRKRKRKYSSSDDEM